MTSKRSGSDERRTRRGERRALGGAVRVPDHDRTRWAAQEAVLRAVEHVAPTVLSSLLERVMPQYRSARDATLPPVRVGRARTPWGGDVIEQPRAAWEHWRFDVRRRPVEGELGEWSAIESASAELRELFRELAAWASAWNLNSPWLMDVALTTVRWRIGWEDRRNQRNSAKYAPPEILEAVRQRDAAEDPEPTGFADPPFVDVAEAQRFTLAFEHPGWVRSWEDWRSFEKQVRRGVQAKLQQSLIEYRARVESDPEPPDIQTDWSSSPVLLSTTRSRHFEWLVRYQVLGARYVEIAEAVHAAPRTVSDTVKRLAALAEIRLRRPDRGRRPRNEGVGR